MLLTVISEQKMIDVIHLLFLVFFRGQTPAEAEKNFILKAHTLATYGVDPHPVRVCIDFARMDLVSCAITLEYPCNYSRGKWE